MAASTLGRGALQDGGDVRLLGAAVGREELEAVAVEGQVAGGDHDGAVVLVPWKKFARVSTL